MLGNLFVMESLKDIARRKMVENLNIYCVTNLLVRKCYRAGRLWMITKIPSNVTFENRKERRTELANELKHDLDIEFMSWYITIFLIM